MRHRPGLLVSGVAFLFAIAGCAADTTAGQAPTGPATVTPAATSAATSVPAAGTTLSTPESLTFTATRLDGGGFSGAEVAGRPVVLWFWAPWCTKCRAASDEVAAVAAGTTVIGVPGLSEDRQAMREFVESTGTAAVIHLGDGAQEVWSRFRVTSQDTYVLLNSDGSVAHQGPIGAADLADRVAALS